jgi:hypothetical protein
MLAASAARRETAPCFPCGLTYYLVGAPTQRFDRRYLALPHPAPDALRPRLPWRNHEYDIGTPRLARHPAAAA